MTDRSDVNALEQMLHYATEEAQRLNLPTLVVRCLRMAVHELTTSDPKAPTNWPTDFSVH
jgi:TPP-dependent pyruvate/acetoin dehydrogenase alpha subunit